jgi:hypothetical protein
MKATKYEFHAYLRAPPQTPLRPNPNQTKHNRQRDPESGIERDVCLGVQDAAEAGLPLCPVVDDAKRVQALQQAEHGGEIREHHEDPAEDAKLLGRLRQAGPGRRGIRLRRQDADPRARRQPCGQDQSGRADDDDDETGGQRVHGAAFLLAAKSNRERRQLHPAPRQRGGGIGGLRPPFLT